MWPLLAELSMHGLLVVARLSAVAAGRRVGGPCSYSPLHGPATFAERWPPRHSYSFGVLQALLLQGGCCAAARLQDGRQGCVEARLAQVLRQEVLAAGRQTVLGELADQLAPAREQLRLSP